MTNIFQQTPVYITADDVRDSTSNTDLQALTNAEIEVLITKAQREVDTYICKTFRPPFEDTQSLIFPVSKEDVSYLPTEITEATLYIVEQLFALGDTVWWSLPYETITSEKIWPRSYNYWDDDKARVWFMIPDIALKLLAKYKNRFTGQSLAPNPSC